MKDELKNLGPFYLASFVYGITAFTGAYFVLYFLGIGLSFFQISLLLAIPSFSSILFDIPTGAIADVYGRKISVVISYIFTGIILLLIPLSKNFSYLFCLFIVWGITDTLRTGADEAWVVSNLKKKKHLIESFYSKELSIINLGYITSPLIAAFIVVKLGMSSLWTFQGLATFVVVGTLLMIKEEFHKEKLHIKESFRNTIQQTKSSIKYSINHPTIFKILIASIFIVFVTAAAGVLWQPYLNGFNIPLSYFGYISSFSAFLAIFAPIVANKISKKFSKKSVYISLAILVYIIILSFILLINSAVLAMIVVLVLYLIVMFIYPVEQPFFQKFVPDKMRASIVSFKNTAGTLGAGIATILVGLAADLIGPRYTLAALSIFLIPALIYYLRIRKINC